MGNDNPMSLTTYVHLKDYFERILIETEKRYEQRFQAQREATMAALSSAQLAVDKAEDNAKAWRANANEWRDAMNDKDKLLATKADLVPINKCLDDLKTFKDNTHGKASQNSVLISYALAFLAILVSLITRFR